MYNSEDKPGNYKLFVGGISINTTEDDLKEYFSKFGKIVSCHIVEDKYKHESQGYAFISFETKEKQVEVAGLTHMIGNRIIDCKVAIPKSQAKGNIIESKLRKIFVGGQTTKTTNDDIYNHFKNFGEIDKAYIIKKHNSEVSRCFGFVEFRCKEALNKVFLQKKHKINGKAIECKPLNENSKYDKQLSANISTNNEKNDIEKKRNSDSPGVFSNKINSSASKRNSKNIEINQIKQNSDEKNLANNTTPHANYANSYQASPGFPRSNQKYGKSHIQPNVYYNYDSCEKNIQNKQNQYNSADNQNQNYNPLKTGDNYSYHSYNSHNYQLQKNYQQTQSPHQQQQPKSDNNSYHYYNNETQSPHQQQQPETDSNSYHHYNNEYDYYPHNQKPEQYSNNGQYDYTNTANPEEYYNEQSNYYEQNYNNNPDQTANQLDPYTSGYNEYHQANDCHMSQNYSYNNNINAYDYADCHSNSVGYNSVSFNHMEENNSQNYDRIQPQQGYQQFSYDPSNQYAHINNNVSKFKSASLDQHCYEPKPNYEYSGFRPVKQRSFQELRYLNEDFTNSNWTRQPIEKTTGDSPCFNPN